MSRFLDQFRYLKKQSFSDGHGEVRREDRSW